MNLRSANHLIRTSVRFGQSSSHPFFTYKTLFKPPTPVHPSLPNRTSTLRSSLLLKSKALHSGISLSTLLGGVVASIAALYLWHQFDSTAASAFADNQLDRKAIEISDNVPWIRVYPGMPPQIPPGRPGNLTKEEEIKLKELWESLNNVFGISTSESEPASAASTRSVSPEPSGKKKHRFGGLLGRRKHDDAEASGTESEDKHGLNKEYKQALASQSPQELKDTFWFFTKADDPDAVLLRYLRARKWNVHDALVMLVATIHWRGNVMHLDDDVMKNGEAGALAASEEGSGSEKKLGEDFLRQMRMGKSFLHGTDREGRPLCVVRVKLHRQGEQSDASLERATVYTIETARLMLRPPVDTAVIFFDMTDFSMANMDYAPVKFMIKVFEANYPESLGAVLVHKAPWIFQGIWSVIKGWLDPVVASKVHFTKNTNELAEFIDIKHVPKSLGGQEDWEYTYIEAVPGENKQMQDTAGKQAAETERARLVQDYEAATAEWVKGAGSGDAAQARRLKLAEALRHNYWKLDPYVRARSVYDRAGVIRPGGVIDFYPAESNGGVNALDGTGNSRGAMSMDAQSVRSVYHDARQEYHEGDVD